MSVLRTLRLSAAFGVLAAGENLDAGRVRAAVRPGQAEEHGRRVVVVARLFHLPVRVRPVDEHVAPRGEPREVEVLAVEERGVAVGEAGRGALVHTELARIARAAVPEEVRAGEVLHTLGRE